jgi:hypothetical protein
VLVVYLGHTRARRILGRFSFLSAARLLFAVFTSIGVNEYGLFYMICSFACGYDDVSGGGGGEGGVKEGKRQRLKL